MSFILDALRKSEHERQRSAVPGLSQVPVATPQPQMPRWALALIGALAAAVLALGAAWWQSARPPAEPLTSAATIERPVELPAPAASSALVQPAQPVAFEPLPPSPGRSPAAAESSPPSTAPTLERAAASSVADDAAEPEATAVELATTAATLSSRLELPADAAALPSATALAAEGVTLPPLRLELHAFSAERRDRFVYINGRKYAEGERLVEGPQLLSIEPTGAVLTHAGRRFMLVQE